MRALALLLFAAFAGACGNAGSTGNLAQPPAYAGPPLPADAAILDGRLAPNLLRQCSRATPPAGEGVWQPTPADVAALEAALPAALAAYHHPELAGAPRGWHRQYGGMLRGGRRFLYGNFFPIDPQANASDPDAWRRSVAVICDGGPVFFGVEYDVAARRFTQIAFNGSA